MLAVETDGLLDDVTLYWLIPYTVHGFSTEN